MAHPCEPSIEELRKIQQELESEAVNGITKDITAKRHALAVQFARLSVAQSDAKETTREQIS